MMKELNVRDIITSRKPDFFEKYPGFLGRLIIRFFERLMHVEEINQLIRNSSNVSGLVFIDEVFEGLSFSYDMSSMGRQRIPADGKLIIVANHPLGGLDGLALLRAISEVRPDVKIIANDVLLNFENLTDLFLPYDVFSERMQKEHVARIAKALLQEKAVIFFPAAEVSRLTPKGIRDPKWLNGPVFFAKKYEVPILPVFIKAKNSFWFYLISLLHKRFSTLLLAHEIFNKKGKSIRLVVGDPIPGAVFSSSFLKTKITTKLLRKHTYFLARRRTSSIFKTEKTIIHPIDRKALKEELLAAESLGKTSDGKQIYLINYDKAGQVMREIARLRELTFRRVGEGTGLKLDLDRFDRYYQHIVLWDDDELEIVGSYRIGDCAKIVATHGVDGLYTNTLFKYTDKAVPLLQNGLELGRSFVQSKYWKTSALDYLWQGIGAYIAKHPEVEYLLGPVSISNNYNEEARSLLVYFYQKWFPGDVDLAPHITPFRVSQQKCDELSLLFTGAEYREDYRTLKEELKVLGFTVPVLYKQYTELCEDGGVSFIDFGLDKDFGNCIDGLILIRMDALKATKRERYININIASTAQ